MKSIIQAMLESIYEQATEVSRATNQVAGEKREFYITLQQLEVILKSFEG